MKEKKTFFVISLLALFLTLLITLVFFVSPQKNIFESLNDNEDVEIAEIESFEGSVFWRSKHETQLHPLNKNKNNFSHLDRIQTSENSNITLSFDNGYKIKILPQSYVLLEYWDLDDFSSSIYINFISGNYSLVESGEQKKLFILKNQNLYEPESKPTQEILALNIKNKNLAKNTKTIIQQEESAPQPETTSDLVDSPIGKTLSNQQIRVELAKQTKLFQRCQMNSLRENGPSTGQALIGFTILPKGKTRNVKVLNSTLNSNFNSCIVSIFERSKFQSFNGQPIVLSYPLVFE